MIGAAGLLGGAVGARLVAEGASVRALVRDAGAGERLTFTPTSVVAADLAEGLPSQVFEGVETVLYLAATSVPADSPNDPAGEFAVSLPALNGVAATLARTAGANARIVFPSSGGSLYAEQTGAADESAELAPRSAYALGKALAEQTLAFWRRSAGLGFDILRITNAYGSPAPRTRPQGVIDVFLDDALAGRTSYVWGSRDVERDFLFVDDAAAALARVALNPTASNRVYNLGYGETRSLAQILALVEHVTGGRHQWSAQGGHYAGVVRSAVDASAFRRDFGWAPNWSPEAGIGETWRRKLATAGRDVSPAEPIRARGS